MWHMIFTKIGNVNIFLVMPVLTRRNSAVCFAIAHYMPWEISVAAILPIRSRELRIAPIACDPTAGNSMILCVKS